MRRSRTSLLPSRNVALVELVKALPANVLPAFKAHAKSFGVMFDPKRLHQFELGLRMATPESTRKLVPASVAPEAFGTSMMTGHLAYLGSEFRQALLTILGLLRAI